MSWRFVPEHGDVKRWGLLDGHYVIRDAPSGMINTVLLGPQSPILSFIRALAICVR
jgi:hypothetical protein